jgi:hypothetical protein
MRCISCLFSALALLGVVSATASAAKPVTKTYNVSLYGIQRYTNTQTENDVHPDKCFGARGTTISRSVVRFHTAKPVRVKATFSAGYVGLVFPDDDLPIPVIADWQHDGESNREERSCVGSQGDGWLPDPLPLANNCHATLDNHGFGISLSTNRIEVRGTSSIIPPLNDTFAGCPWGDQSIQLYAAKANVRAALIRDGAQSESILRGRERTHNENPDGSGVSDIVKQTTVYLTFKRR